MQRVKCIRRRPAPEPDPGFLPGCHPVLRRVLAARAVGSDRDLDHSLARLFPPRGFLDLDRAVSLLDDVIESGARIVVVGDYDADGATGCALAVRGLRLLGAARVGFEVPNRMHHGYGLSPEIVEIVRSRHHDPRLIVTVDNGISSIEGVARAKQLGIGVLITDHHLPGARLPAADAIVNPNRPGDGFPSKCLAGVGVMFYVLGALRARRRRVREHAQGRGCASRGEEPNLAALLDLVALGTGGRRRPPRPQQPCPRRAGPAADPGRAGVARGGGAAAGGGARPGPRRWRRTSAMPPAPGSTRRAGSTTCASASNAC